MQVDRKFRCAFGQDCLLRLTDTALIDTSLRVPFIDGHRTVRGQTPNAPCSPAGLPTFLQHSYSMSKLDIVSRRHDGKRGVAVLGIYVADLTFRAPCLPGLGQTIAGTGFAIGPGGKGSNQAVAAARAGAAVTFISAVGVDAFADQATALWHEAGVAPHVRRIAGQPTGAAFIYLNDVTGDNAIIVVAGAAAQVSVDDVAAAADIIAGARVFVTQLEQPADAALRGLQIARAAGTITVFNPAPAVPIDDAIYRLCDFITPNEHEAALLTGLPVGSLEQARAAGDVLLARGVGCALITLGARGALLHSAGQSQLIAPLNAGPVVETTGAGDAFNGGFAAALAEGATPLAAARFAAAVAAIAVTRAGTAPSMPRRAEVDSLLAAAATSA